MVGVQKHRQEKLRLEQRWHESEQQRQESVGQAKRLQEACHKLTDQVARLQAVRPGPRTLPVEGAPPHSITHSRQATGLDQASLCSPIQHVVCAWGGCVCVRT